MELLIPKVNLGEVNEEELTQFWEQYRNYVGWRDLELLSEKNKDIKEKSEFIVQNCDVFLVVGIGGSYVGARAVIDALQPYFEEKKPEIYYVGNSLSSEYLYNLKEKIRHKNVIINYVSKSGKTLESKIVFADLQRFMAEKYDEEEMKKRIVYTVGNTNIVPDGYDYFLIPDDVGGRFSVFTPAGLLPIAVAGIDIEKLLQGAAKADIQDAQKYALYRWAMEKDDIAIEAFVVYEPKLFYFIEWLKQLYAESLGKAEKGIFPVGLINTTDLHSLGQFLQEGRKNIMETVLIFEDQTEVLVPEYNCFLKDINAVAQEANTKAHQERVPNLLIKMGILNEVEIGKLMQFFMLACAINGFLQDVNPFDQEGVEVYKKEMQAMLKS